MGTRIERAMRTLRTMFVGARGFPSVASAEETNGMVGMWATGHATKPDVRVFIHAGKLGIQPVRDLSTHITACTHVIIVYVGTITSHAREELKRLRGGVRTIETFKLGSLQFNIMDHVCVPPQAAIRQQEVRTLGLVSEQLPELLRIDPVARWHNWGPGTVVRTTLSNPEGHSFHEYRRVT